jgi:Holliday junction DNA helicase RuvB
VDRKILHTIADKFDGGPVGLNNLSTALGEETDTISEKYEPFLIMKGFIQRTQQGRIITARGRQHINFTGGQGKLF